MDLSFRILVTVDMVPKYCKSAASSSSISSPNTQYPLLILAGSRANTLYFCENAVKNEIKPQELFTVPRESHIGFYGQTEATDLKPTKSFRQYLQ